MSRAMNKLYEATTETGSKKAGQALKAALLARVESERNLFYADKIVASNSGVVTARLGYAPPRGTATPTHIRELVDSVAYKAQIETGPIAVVRVAV